MKWIKVTPETMPPDMEEVLVTATGVNDDGTHWKETWPNIRWVAKPGHWEQPSYPFIDDWDWCSDKTKITHWMPYPEPAED